MGKVRSVVRRRRDLVVELANREKQVASLVYLRQQDQEEKSKMEEEIKSLQQKVFEAEAKIKKDRFLTTDLTAENEDLQDELSDLSRKHKHHSQYIEQLEKDLSSLEAEKSNLTTQITDLHGNLEAEKNERISLQANYDKIKGKLEHQIDELLDAFEKKETDSLKEVESMRLRHEAELQRRAKEASDAIQQQVELRLEKEATNTELKKQIKELGENLARTVVALRSEVDARRKLELDYKKLEDQFYNETPRESAKFSAQEDKREKDSPPLKDHS